LLIYTGEKKLINDKYYHARKFLRLPLNQTDGDDLRQEAYLQLLKQLKDNPNPKKLDNAWALLCMLASSYTPSLTSNRLYFSILNHLFYLSKVNDGNTNIEILRRIEYTYSHLFHISSLMRFEIPSTIEMKYIEKMRPITIPIYLFSGDFFFISFETYDSVREVKQAIIEKLVINPKRMGYYGIYEVATYKDKKEERFLEGSKNMADVLSAWERTRKLENNHSQNIDFKLYLRIKFHYKISDDDLDTLSILFYENVYNFLNGRYDLNEKFIISLASLKLLNDFSSDKEEAFKKLNNRMEDYIPWDCKEMLSHSEWTEKIMELYSQFPDYSTIEIQKNFNELLAKNLLSESHFVIATVNKI
jgi:hypothetical protein